MFEGLTFKVAAPDERVAAYRLREEVYLQDLGHIPMDRFDADAFHLIAYATNQDVVAVLRIVGPHQRPFDFEEHVNLNDLIGPNRNPALIGRLAVRRDFRIVSRSTFVHVGLLKLSVALSVSHGITDFFLYTYPNLIDFYRSALFELTSVTFPHSDWGQVHLMHADLSRMAERASKSPSGLAGLIFGTNPRYSEP